MSDTTRTQLDLELTRLTKRIEELITSVEHLKEENRAAARHESLAGARRAHARRAGAHARGAMIGR